MPVLVPCGEPGCPELVTRGRCAKHSKAKSAERLTTKQRGYAGTWPALRKMILRRDKYCCQECLRREDRVTLATDVDHKIRMSDGGAARDPENLESLCRACHGQKTWRESHPQ